MVNVKFWLLSVLVSVFVLSVSAQADAYPVINHPVVDNAGVLTPADVEDIAARELEHFQRTHVQIALLTVPSLNGEPIEDFANGTAHQWRGGQAGLNNGILVVLAINEHRSRIELGAGLEGHVTDSEATEFLDDARPSFRAGMFGAGARSIIGSLIMATGGTPSTISHAGWTYHQPSPPFPWGYFILALIFVFVVIFVIVSISKSRDTASRGYGGSSGYYGGGGGGSSSSFVYIDNSSSSSSSSSSGSSSSWDSGSSSDDSGWSGGGGDFGGGGGSSDW